MKKSQKQALAVGAGLAAIAAAATGVYMMTGKNAKNRKKVSKWVGDVQSDIVKQLNKAGKVSKQAYNKVVDTAMKNYKGVKNISADELALVASDLKSSWDAISKEVTSASKIVRKVVPKAAKNIAKKVSGNSSKKTAKKVTKKAAPKKQAAKKRR